MKMNRISIPARQGLPRLAVPSLRKPLLLLGLLLFWGVTASAQIDFQLSKLKNANGFSTSGYQGTSLEFGPDGRLYMISLKGEILVIRIERNGPADYEILDMEVILSVKNTPNHDDDGSPNGGNDREATGITVVGTPANPVIYATSSDSRVGGPSGDTDLDTNSGVITRISWNGSNWETVDLVRGLPRSEENHAANGLEFVSMNGKDYLLVCSGGNTNGGAPSKNFAWITEYALASAVLIVDLTALEGMPIKDDNGRKYVYDLPTVDDPTRPNVNGIVDPNAPGYDGIDVNDPWGGNDGLNQAKLVENGPVQIFSGGYRNTYDLVYTESGAVYVTDNGANGGWGGYPENEGMDGTVTNNYRVTEPGSSKDDGNEQKVNNLDHLSLVTTDITSYTWGDFYAGHPTPIRGNPAGAGLFARGPHSSDPTDANGNGYTDDWFRTIPYDPNGVGEAADPKKALPADWPPVPVSMADIREGDYRLPGLPNPDGPDDELVTIWENNTNGIDEYTASNFGGAMKGNLVAGKSGGILQRVVLNPDGSLDSLETRFATGMQGNPLGVTCNADTDPFPGTIWIATLTQTIHVFEPLDFVTCDVEPGDPEYTSEVIDSDADGYFNKDEVDNNTDVCKVSSRPEDFDIDFISDMNDKDDDSDGLEDGEDPFQLGQPFDLPIYNTLLTEENRGGYANLGFTGFMNNGDTSLNWVDWTDKRGPNGESLGPNPNDLLGGAIGGVTQQMTGGTAVGSANDQKKGLQLGANVDESTGLFVIQSRMDNFNDPLQLFGGNAPQGEMGIFMGDGTQSNFLQFVATVSGLEMMMEINDTQSELLTAGYPIPTEDIDNINFEFHVDPVAGTVEGMYFFNSTFVDNPTVYSIGTINLAGSILEAVQQASKPLAAGLIGTSNDPAKELESTWGFMYVLADGPGILASLPDLIVEAGAPVYSDDLTEYFVDDGSVDSLEFSVVGNTDPAVQVSVVGNTMEVSFPSKETSSTVTIRATDKDGLFVDAEFTVTVNEESNVLFRVNSGGPEIPAIDGGIDWGQDLGTAKSPYLVQTGSNGTNSFIIEDYDPSVDTSRVPTDIFNTERSDASGGNEMIYSFPVEVGVYEVRLYIGDGFSATSEPGERVYSVQVEDEVPPVFSEIDPSGQFGHKVGGVLSYSTTVVDGQLDITFLHSIAENPLINGIEIVGQSADAPVTLAPIPDQFSRVGDTEEFFLQGLGGDPNESFAYTLSGQPDGITLVDPTTGRVEGTIPSGAENGGPNNDGIYTLIATATKPSSGTAVDTFLWQVKAAEPEVFVTIRPDGAIDASTSGSSENITIINASSEQITSLSIDLTTTVFPDLVFDPTGAAGDGLGQCFNVNPPTATATGLQVFLDPCVDPFTQPYQAGYQGMELQFTNFDPGDTLQFSVDIDPNSLQGLSESSGPGKISGLELVGATFSATLSGGGNLTGQVFEDGSLGGGRANLIGNPGAGATIAFADSNLDQDTFGQREQVIEVSGQPGKFVEILVINADLNTKGQKPFNVTDQTFYGNQLLNRNLYTIQLDGNGNGEVEVTLFPSSNDLLSGIGGVNYLVALQDDIAYSREADILAGLSNVLVARYLPTDRDLDGIPDPDDNCPDIPNPNQNLFTFWLDADNDGFGTPDSSVQACEAPADFVDNNLDCDDEAAAINPDAVDIPNDLIDQDCDGLDSTSTVDQVSFGAQIAGDYPFSSGSLFDVTLQVESGIQPFNEVVLNLIYNTEVLQVIGFELADELDDVTTPLSYDNSTGLLQFAANKSSGTLSGTVDVVTLSFIVLAADTTELDFLAADINSNVLLNGISVLNSAEALVLTPSQTTETVDRRGIVRDVALFPNPASANLNVSVKGESGERIRLRLLNLNGQVLHQENTNLIGGDGQFRLDLNGLNMPAGVYYLQLISDTYSYPTMPFIRK